MPGHRRPKDGVLSHTCVPGVHAFLLASKGMAGTSPAMTS